MWKSFLLNDFISNFQQVLDPHELKYHIALTNDTVKLDYSAQQNYTLTMLSGDMVNLRFDIETNAVRFCMISFIVNVT